MSKANLQAFYQKFRTDLALQSQLDGITDSAEYAKQAVRLGERAGLDFTVAEVEAALAAPVAFLEESIGEELNDLELLVVAGGVIQGCDPDTKDD